MAREDPYNEFWDIVHSAPDYDYDEQAEAVHAASDLVELPDSWELRLTCGACPEQYELYDKHQRIAGYFRLRYGSFYVAFPDVGGEVVYQHEYHGDPLLGVFPDQEHRVFQLELDPSHVRADRAWLPIRFDVTPDLRDFTIVFEVTAGARGDQTGDWVGLSSGTDKSCLFGS